MATAIFEEVKTEDYLNLRGEDDEVNIALVGETGCGRASFVNAIRGLRDDDEDAAKIGKLGGTTSKIPTCYSHPKNAMMHFWILPSFDLKSFPNFNSFFDCVNLEMYDAFLIFTAAFFKERHLEFALKMKSKGKPFFLIRTKIDNDCRHGNRKEDFKEEETLNKVRAFLAESLQDLPCSKEDIFLISNHHRDKWDFGRVAKAVSDISPIPKTKCLPKFEFDVTRFRPLTFDKTLTDGESSTDSDILSANESSTDNNSLTDNKTSTGEETPETSTASNSSTHDNVSKDDKNSTDEESSKGQSTSAWETVHGFLKVVMHGMTFSKLLKSTRDVQKAFMTGGVTGVQKTMREKLEQWKNIDVSVAIIGNSGVGKSSFINAIRGLEDADKDAAETGIKETTLEPTVYPHPTNSKIKFWDLPGIGTPNYPNFETFCKKIELEKYDTFLILSANRFTQHDWDFATKVGSMEKPFFFIRTKIDQDRDNEKRKLKENFNKKKMLTTIREDCLKNLKQCINFKQEEIFLVSNHYRDKWDFDRLEDAILNKLPSKQKEALAFSLKTDSKILLKNKVQVLKGRVWRVALASVVSKVGMGPFSLFVDKILVAKKVEFYRQQLGFPETDSKEFKMMSPKLQERIKKFSLNPDQDFSSWIKTLDSTGTYNIRVHGPVMFTKKPLKFVYEFLRCVLDGMEKTAEAIFDEEATNKRSCDSKTD